MTKKQLEKIIQNKEKLIMPLKGNRRTLIKVDKVSKSFGNKKHLVRALNKCSFIVREGENISLVGANGAGKTTIVEIMAGLNKPDSGKIHYHLGCDKADLFSKIGIQFQDSKYPTGISVKRIISFILDAYNVKMTKDELNEMLEIFGVKAFYRHQASSLSGGQQQRLNILLALLHKPKILFLDELSTGLDINVRNKIKRFIKDYSKKYGINIILVSHDANEVEFLADRMIIMQKGNIIVDIMIDDIKKMGYNVEEFITKFL